MIVVTGDAVNRSSPLQVPNRSHYKCKRCGEPPVRFNSTVKLCTLMIQRFTVSQEGIRNKKDTKSQPLELKCRGHQDVNLSSTFTEGCTSIRQRTRFGDAFKWVEALLESATSGPTRGGRNAFEEGNIMNYQWLALPTSKVT